MFENAVERAQLFTRPIHSVLRNFGSSTLQPINATLFFVNAEGWALTCRHVADNLLAEAALDQRNLDFQTELTKKPAKTQPGQWKREVERKFSLNKEATWEIRNQLGDCVVAGTGQYQVVKHPTYDIALIKFSDPLSPTIANFPLFPSDSESLKVGRTLCRLGFPFPEFTNYSLDTTTDRVTWNSTGSSASPFFANDGMVTRFAADANGICELELSTPGIKGQSGGPVFDQNGVVWGIQHATVFLDLDFDVKDFKVYRNGIEKTINAHSMLNLGRAVHSKIVTEFMKSNGVSFQKST